MADPTPEQVLHELLDQLGLEEQCRVLEFARTLARDHVRLVPGHDLIRFAGSIAAEDLATIGQAIEDDCERVNRDEW